ncbi:MAG: efflux RND transporter periplasmic adaptor subunit [Vicinamibacterales bacterium]
MRYLKNPRLLVAAAIVAGILAVALWPAAVEVDVAQAARTSMRVTIDEEGETRVRDRFLVSAPVSGRLQRIELEPGDAVTRGAVLARIVPAAPPLIDPRTQAELSAAVAAAGDAVGQARAERDRAAATLARARADLQRQQTLAAAGAVPREAAEVAQTAAATAEEAVRAAEFAVARAENEQRAARARLAPSPGGGRTVDIVSPADGVVLRRLRESEAVVPAGDALIEIGDPRTLEVVSDLLSTDAVRVAGGAPVLIEQWGGPHPLTARVRRVEPSGFMKVSALGVEEQRVNVVIDFADPAAASLQLGDGYRVEVRVITWEADDVLTLPVGSLFRQGEGWATFVVEGGRARLQSVEIGQRNESLVEVLGGVAAGQRVVLHPPDTLADGARVAIRPGQP